MTKPVVTLAAAFAAFEQLALGGMSSAERNAMRGAYYSGAAAMWGQISETWTADPNAVGAHLDALREELENFRAEAARRAG